MLPKWCSKFRTTRSNINCDKKFAFLKNSFFRFGLQIRLPSRLGEENSFNGGFLHEEIYFYYTVFTEKKPGKAEIIIYFRIRLYTVGIPTVQLGLNTVAIVATVTKGLYTVAEVA